MGVEVKQFRVNVRNWLLGISGMSAQVGTRVFAGWPVEEPTYPVVCFDLSRKPVTDYPIPAWGGTLGVEIHSPDEDTRDTIENLITEHLGASGTAIRTTLSTAGTVLCRHFQLAGVPADSVFADVRVTTQLLVGVRRLEFDFVIVATGE